MMKYKLNYQGEHMFTKYKIGDVVRVHNTSDIYSIWHRVFEHFGIMRNGKIPRELPIPNNVKNMNWVIFGITCLPLSNNKLIKLYHIKTINNLNLVVAESGLTKHMSLPRLEKFFKNTNKKYIIKKL